MKTAVKNCISVAYSRYLLTYFLPLEALPLEIDIKSMVHSSIWVFYLNWNVNYPHKWINTFKNEFPTLTRNIACFSHNPKRQDKYLKNANLLSMLIDPYLIYSVE